MQEFIESPIEPKCTALKSFVGKIKEKGFNFHPGKVLEALNKEAERQYAEIFTACFQGANISVITQAQEETFNWMQSEDARYSEWQQGAKLEAMSPVEVPEVIVETINEPVAPAVSIKKGKRK